jgi:hypothetical protein
MRRIGIQIGVRRRFAERIVDQRPAPNPFVVARMDHLARGAEVVGFEVVGSL